MGVYTDFYIGEYLFCTSRDDVIPILMTLFREKDRKNYIDESDAADNIYKYENTAINIKKRLDILGFTMNNIKSFFDDYQRSNIEQLENYILYDSSDDILENANLILELIINTKEFDVWINCIKEIYHMQIPIAYDINDIPKGINNVMINYMLDNDYGEYIFKFPYLDIRSMIRIFLEFTEDNIIVSQDVTDLILCDAYADDDEICEINLEKLVEFYPLNSKILILTEGSSDAILIKKSFELIYPDLVDYYHFMDFDISNANGGKNALTSIVRGFIGSGIINRVIALFDNDAAGNYSKSLLLNKYVPDNIKILSFPNINEEYIYNYPCIENECLNNININGLGCSIELYLGLDCLTKDGNILPLRFIGFENKLKQYKISNKRYIQMKFQEKLLRINGESDKNYIKEMCLILDTIIHAFIL